MRILAVATASIVALSAFLGIVAQNDQEQDLPIGILQTEDTAAVNVNVSDEAGRRISEASVYVEGNDTVWQTNESGSVLIEGFQADAEGTNYTLWAGKEGYLNSTPKNLTVHPLTTYWIELTIQGGRVTCVVYSTETVVIAGAVVIVEGLNYSDITGIDGRCVFNGIPTGSYNFTANASGHENDTISVTVEAGADHTQVFVLKAMIGTIFGVVSSVNGPLVGAVVSISGTSFLNVTSAGGSYALIGVPVGTHLVSARATGYKTSEKLVTVVIDLPVLQDFVLEQLYGGAISGFVYHESTLEPLAGASVSTIVGGVTFSVQSGANGSYKIPNLPPGDYSVTASLSGFNSGTQSPVSVTTGNETTGIDFYLEEKPTLLYGVVKAGPTLLVNVKVTVIEANLTAYTTIEGEFEIRNITAGTYNVTASLEGYITARIADVVIPRGGEKGLSINLTGLPGSLSGTVVASDTRLPLSGARVTITGAQAVDRSTITNIQGQFEFKGLPEGSYSVVFDKDGYRPVEISPVPISVDTPVNLTEVLMVPLREAFGGFVFGFDLAHSMMILALFMTIVVLALAVYLRIRSFQAPETAPAVYDELEEEAEEEEEKEAAADGER